MKHFLLLTAACAYELIVFAQSGFVVYPGIHVVKSGSPVLVLQNMNLLNNGTFVPGNGTVQLTGNNAIAVNGTNLTNFYNLYAGSSGSVVLGQNIIIQNELKMAGMMQVQNQEVKLEPTAFINDLSETARLQASAGNTGHATITLDMNLPVRYNKDHSLLHSLEALKGIGLQGPDLFLINIKRRLNVQSP